MYSNEKIIFHLLMQILILKIPFKNMRKCFVIFYDISFENWKLLIVISNKCKYCKIRYLNLVKFNKNAEIIWCCPHTTFPYRALKWSEYLYNSCNVQNVLNVSVLFSLMNVVRF